MSAIHRLPPACPIEKNCTTSAIIFLIGKVSWNFENSSCPVSGTPRSPRWPQATLAKAIPALGGWRRGNALETGGRAKALTEVIRDAPDWEILAFGAYFAFVRHPFVELSAHDATHILARQAGVITIPGSFFGNGLERYLRVAFANADVATIRQLGKRFAVDFRLSRISAVEIDVA